MWRTIRILGICGMMIAFAACMKATDETIVIPVRNKVIPPTVLSLDYQDSLRQYMPIYEGDNPPNIEGSYITAPMDLVYASDGFDNIFFNLFWKTSNQNWWNRILYKEWQGNAEGIANEAWVIGDGSCFTMYTVEQSKNEIQGWNYEAVLILSGEKTNAGIANYHYAIVMRNKVDDNGVLIEPDSYRIFTDGDGLSSLTNGTMK